MIGKQFRLRQSVNHEKRLFFVSLLLILVIIGGTFGYSYIEGWNTLDSFYMTLITVTTIGYGEIHSLSAYGRMFTSVVIVTGVGVMGYFLGTFTQYIVEGEIRKTFGLRKMKKDIKNLNNHYIVCGYGKVGRQVCEELRHRGIETIVIESDRTMADHALHDGFYAIHDDAAADDAMNKAKIQNAKGLVGAVGSDADNVFITLTAKELNPNIFVVVRAESPSSQKKLRRAGANRVISPDLIGGKKMALAAIRPNIVEFMDIITPDEKTNFTIEEIIVESGSSIAGLTIKESKVRQTAGVIIIGIKKNGDFIFNPLAEDRIIGGDILIVVGNEKQLDTMYRICS
ncbi:TrkA family potassium uptake protein [Candidatus Uabimicrobium sp. HlEnr_7]|uniref:potassium channel family protein n=1 Tax=Candidatus Uabimicrobium helgolandensis TaxID=3095367 RepID=UPI003555F96A